MDELKLGSIIAEDILVNTQSPIIRKDTKVSREHIQVLHAFNINKVPIAIENQFNRTDEEIISKLNNEKVNKMKKETPPEMKVKFINLYNNGVNNYHKEFSSWESGMKVDVAKLRNILIPLIESASAERQIFFHLNDYSSVERYIAHHSIAVGILSGAMLKNGIFRRTSNSNSDSRLNG